MHQIENWFGTLFFRGNGKEMDTLKMSSELLQQMHQVLPIWCSGPWQKDQCKGSSSKQDRGVID